MYLSALTLPVAAKASRHQGSFNAVNQAVMSERTNPAACRDPEPLRHPGNGAAPADNRGCSDELFFAARFTKV